MYVWDPAKSLSNKLKHGINFEDARDHVFEGENIIVSGIARDEREPRYAVIGKFRGHYYVGIFTIRKEGVRIISVRRAKREEEKQVKARGL